MAVLYSKHLSSNSTAISHVAMTATIPSADNSFFVRRKFLQGVTPGTMHVVADDHVHGLATPEHRVASTLRCPRSNLTILKHQLPRKRIGVKVDDVIRTLERLVLPTP